MPRRRWRTLARREPLSAAVVAYLTTCTLPPPEDPAYGDLRWFMAFRPSAGELAAVWGEHGTEITADWICDHAGSRPWAWWLLDADEARLAVAGAELLIPKREPTDFEFVWRKGWGVPAFVQCRPRGYMGLPSVEAQASYLDRHGLLGATERADLEADAFDPEDVDPFLIDAEEIDRLPSRGEAA